MPWTKAGVQRDKAGKIIGFGGFGHMNAYRARLVLQSVSDVTSKEIDYSKTLAITKNDNVPARLPCTRSQMRRSEHHGSVCSRAPVRCGLCPGVPAGIQLKRAVDAFGKEGEHNSGVIIVHGAGNEAAAKFEGKGTVDSPDGLLFTCTFNLSRLEGDAQGRAIIFAGENVANLRNPEPENVGAGLLRSGESRLGDHHSGRFRQQAEDHDAAGRLSGLELGMAASRYEPESGRSDRAASCRRRASPQVNAASRHVECPRLQERVRDDRRTGYVISRSQV